MRSPFKLRSFQPYGTCFFSRIVSHIMTLASYSGKKKSGLYKVGTILTFSPPPTSHFSFLLQLDFLHLSSSVPFFPSFPFPFLFLFPLPFHLPLYFRFLFPSISSLLGIFHFPLSFPLYFSSFSPSFPFPSSSLPCYWGNFIQP